VRVRSVYAQLRPSFDESTPVCNTVQCSIREQYLEQAPYAAPHTVRAQTSAPPFKTTCTNTENRCPSSASVHAERRALPKLSRGSQTLFMGDKPRALDRTRNTRSRPTLSSPRPDHTIHQHTRFEQCVRASPMDRYRAPLEESVRETRHQTRVAVRSTIFHLL